MPETVAVPTVVPPVVHVAGAVACGPNTLNVIVPVAPLVPPDRLALIAKAAIALPAAPEPGPDALVVVVAVPTTVEAIPLPHALADAASLASPP